MINYASTVRRQPRLQLGRDRKKRGNFLPLPQLELECSPTQPHSKKHFVHMVNCFINMF